MSEISKSESHPNDNSREVSPDSSEVAKDVSKRDLTGLLRAAGDGDTDAAERVLPLIYEELKSLARVHLARQGNDLTLEPTGLVNEAYYRLLGKSPSGEWDNRGHFFGAAARCMRQILVDQARHASRQKRGGDRRRLTLDSRNVAPFAQGEDLLALDDALNGLKSLDTRKFDVVMLRFFAGLTIDETATSLGIAPATVKADWSFARAWLHSEIQHAS